jgi:hypothetical protein
MSRANSDLSAIPFSRYVHTDDDEYSGNILRANDLYKMECNIK